jgi:dissimilatory sulfite reductase related protein
MSEHSGKEETASDLLIRRIHGRRISFDDEGFFTDFEDWSEAVFELLAKESGILQLTNRHWQVVRFFREYYAYNGRVPMNREVREGIPMSILELERLFPEGIKRGARRLAGLPNPKTCS